MGPAFFIATFVFLLVFGLISFRVLHETIAALMGAVTILGVSYILGASNPDFWILSFEKAIDYIDFNVIFLIMGMMILVAIMGRTGVFQWLGYQAYRVTGGNAWYLAVLLITITAVGSAFLNNVPCEIGIRKGHPPCPDKRCLARPLHGRTDMRH